MEKIQLTYGTQKVCPSCSTVSQQRRIETEFYIEYQMFCSACRFFERFRIQKWPYTIPNTVGMASAFFEPIQGELRGMREEKQSKEQNAWANLEAMAC